MLTQDQFVREFIKLRDGMIRSTLERVGQQLRSQGHEYQLNDDPILSTHPALSPPYGSLNLRIFPKDVDWVALERFGPLNKVPFISFGLNLAERKVAVFVNPSSEGNRYGTRTIRTTNHYTLEEMTPEVVEREVEQFIKEIPLEL